MVMIGPAQRVVEELLTDIRPLASSVFLQQSDDLHIASMIGSMVPEGTHLSCVVRLPISVDPQNGVDDIVCRHLLGISRRQQP